MSHYALMVVTDESPTHEALVAALAPFEEKAPNTKQRWDWWQVGGRFDKRLVTRPSGNRTSVARVDSLDLDAMREEQVRKRLDSITSVMPLDTAAADWPAFAAAIRAARASWVADGEPDNFSDRPDVVEAVRMSVAGVANSMIRYGPDPEKVDDLRAWVTSAHPLPCFAFLKDGEWSERGEMGWFGCVFDDTPDDRWHARLDEFLASLRPTQWVVLVDCHI